MNATTNKAAMSAAVSRWFEEAADMPAEKAARHLNLGADRIDNFIRILGRNDLPTPAHLEGLTYWSLSEQSDRLRQAAFEYERKAAA